MMTIVAEAGGVGDEVGDGALEGLPLQRQHQLVLGLAHAHLDRRAEVLGLLLHLAQQLADVGRRGLLAAVALGERQIVLEHVLHLADVVLAAPAISGLLAQQRKLQLEARQHRAQVVADACQHGGALLDVMADALAHLQERLRRLPHLARPARPEVGRQRAGPCRRRRPPRQAAAPGGSDCAGTGSPRSAAPPTCPPSTSGRCASSRRRSARAGRRSAGSPGRA